MGLRKFLQKSSPGQSSSIMPNFRHRVATVRYVVLKSFEWYTASYIWLFSVYPPPLHSSQGLSVQYLRPQWSIISQRVDDNRPGYDQQYHLKLAWAVDREWGKSISVACFSAFFCSAMSRWVVNFHRIACVRFPLVQIILSHLAGSYHIITGGSCIWLLLSTV